LGKRELGPETRNSRRNTRGLFRERGAECVAPSLSDVARLEPAPCERGLLSRSETGRRSESSGGGSLQLRTRRIRAAGPFGVPGTRIFTRRAKALAEKFRRDRRAATAQTLGMVLRRSAGRAPSVSGSPSPDSLPGGRGTPGKPPGPPRIFGGNCRQGGWVHILKVHRSPTHFSR
jgi:hypothetical protein